MRTTILLAALALAATMGCRRAPAGPPNVLLITIDTLRADHCSSYGYSRPTSPRLDRLAGEGARFAVAYAAMPSTAPSHTTMFTSLYPRSHGVVKNGLVIPPGNRTLAQMLQERGYETGAVVSSFAVDHEFGFDRGFERYDDVFDPREATSRATTLEGRPVTGGYDQRATTATTKAIGWLDHRRGRSPFFLWVHYFDPHHPYVPPEPYRTALAAPAGASDLQREIAAYDGEIAYTDAEIGRLLDALDAKGLRETTLVALTADHGEGLMQHGHMNHGLFLYDEGVRVPLVFRWPGHVPAGTTVAEPVALLDLTPTLLDLLGAPRAAWWQGRSLAEALTAATPPDPRPIFLQRRTYGVPLVRGFRVAGAKLGVRSGPWKYIEAPAEGTRELFDLRVDPDEQHNVAALHPEEARALSQALADWQQSVGEGAASASVSAEAAEKLRALGYVQ